MVKKVFIYSFIAICFIGLIAFAAIKTTQLANTRDTLASTQVELTATQSDLSNNQATLVTTKAKLSQTQTDLSSNQATLATTKAELSQTRTDLSGNQATLATTKTELSQTRTDLSDTKATLTTTEAKLSQTQADLSTAKKDLSDSQAEWQTTSTKLKETTAELETAQADYTSALASLNTENALADTLQDSLDNLQINYDSTTADYDYAFRDPTYQELKDFIATDTTNLNPYILPTYVCEDFSFDVKNHANQQKIRCAYVYLYLAGIRHGIVAFNTTDKGIIYIEPQMDREVKLQIGKHYWSECVGPDQGVPTEYDDTVTQFLLIW